jgi:hypothetical protein
MTTTTADAMSERMNSSSTVTALGQHHVALRALCGCVAVGRITVECGGAVSDGGAVKAKTKGGASAVVVQRRHVAMGCALRRSTEQALTESTS